MTEIIPYLHQIGLHELNEIKAADLVIDMDGIIHIEYGYSVEFGYRDQFKSKLTCPVISFEIDEVSDEPFRDYEIKMPYLREIADWGGAFVDFGYTVYTLCLAGQNRSGLMNCAIMMMLGYSAKEAVNRIQSKRENALNNDVMGEYILRL